MIEIKTAASGMIENLKFEDADVSFNPAGVVVPTLFDYENRWQFIPYSQVIYINFSDEFVHSDRYLW